DSLIALCRDARAAAPSLSAGILSLISSPDRPRRHRWSLPFNDLARRRLANHPDAILVDAAAAFDALTETERATLFDSDRVHLQKSG
ncbi:hypothetical protein ACI4CD_29235, partial [Klebsiella pneumoniae]|uniref:hypothetical protein n=1 Tax=Klebsiella pneumoniae TaxID=573 RepID=UPI003853CABB